MPASLTVAAEWRDVERSVKVALGQVEMALIDSEMRPLEKRFTVQTIRAESGWLTARPEVAPPFPDDAPIPIRLETQIGYFGNPHAERDLLRAVARRLRTLRGREWAPQ